MFAAKLHKQAPCDAINTVPGAAEKNGRPKIGGPCDVQFTNATRDTFEGKKEVRILGHTPQTLADMDVGEKPPGMDLRRVWGV